MNTNKKKLTKFLYKILQEIKNEEPVVIPDKEIAPDKIVEPPQPKRRRKLVPDKWPEHTPGPKPKAESKKVESITETLKKIKTHQNYIRNQQLLKENNLIQKEMSMNITDPDYADVHPSVKKGIEGEKKTAFTGLDFFQGGKLDYSTLEKLGSEEFNKIIADVKPFGKISGEKELLQILMLMLSLEAPNKKKLEQLALKKVKEQFGLPDEISDKLEIRLTGNPVEMPDEDSDNLAADVAEELEFTDDEKKIIKQHIEKRKIQNALMMGAGFRAHSVFNSIKSELDQINPKLYPLYEKVMPNVSLFMWQLPIEDIMGEIKQVNFMDGVSKIKKTENNEIKAEVQAGIFPILLHETAKAAIELLFAGYLIDLTEKYGAKVAGEIINKSDVFEEEIWMKRIGPTLWKYLHDVIDYIIVHEYEKDYTLVSYLLNDISMMEPEEFVSFMNDVIYNGNRAIEKIKTIIKNIEDDIESEEPLPKDTDEESLKNIIQDVNSELRDLSKQAKEKSNTEIAKDFDSMDLNTLQVELQLAIDEERYEDASKIVKSIDKKK